MAIYLWQGTILTEGGSIAIHEDCCCGDDSSSSSEISSSGVEREAWKDCNTDDVVAIYEDISNSDWDGPDDDYAWLCIDSIWVPCYRELSFPIPEGIAVDPEWLEQCGYVPASCEELVGWPLSDDFGGSGCNSGDFGDTNWNVRYTGSSHDPNTSFSSGAIDAELHAPSAQKAEAWSIRSISFSGDFTIKIYYSGLSRISGDISFFSNILIDGLYHQGARYKTETDDRIDWVEGFTAIGESEHLSGYLEWARSGNTLSLGFNGTTYHSWTVTENLTGLVYGLFAYGDFPAEANVTISSIIASGGIYINPSGASCP